MGWVGLFGHHLRRSSNQAAVAASYMRVELNARKNQSILSCQGEYTRVLPGHPIRPELAWPSRRLAAHRSIQASSKSKQRNNLNKCRLLLAWLTGSGSGEVSFTKKRQPQKSFRHHVDPPNALEQVGRASDLCQICGKGVEPQCPLCSPTLNCTSLWQTLGDCGLFPKTLLFTKWRTAIIHQCLRQREIPNGPNCVGPETEPSAGS